MVAAPRCGTIEDRREMIETEVHRETGCAMTDLLPIETVVVLRCGTIAVRHQEIGMVVVLQCGTAPEETDLQCEMIVHGMTEDRLEEIEALHVVTETGTGTDVDAEWIIH